MFALILTIFLHCRSAKSSLVYATQNQEKRVAKRKEAAFEANFNLVVTIRPQFVSGRTNAHHTQQL